MTPEEYDVIERIPDKFRPLTAWSYFWYSVLFAIPFIGFIALIVCAFSSSNINRRSYARSYFCGVILLFIIILVLGGIPVIANVFDQIFHFMG